MKRFKHDLADIPLFFSPHGDTMLSMHPPTFPEFRTYLRISFRRNNAY